MKPLDVIGIVGSLRKDSYNRHALVAAQALMPEGATLTLVDLEGIPVFNQDNEKALPPAVAAFKQRIRVSDAILFATPEYNYSVPGALKNAIDWASRPYGENAWLGKPTAIMGASIGNLGTARAQYHLRQILVAFDMPVVSQPEVMITRASEKFGADGRLTDESTRQHVAKLLEALVKLARLAR